MSDEAPTYLLVDGENIDATLGIQVLGHRPQPEERPRWERVRDFSAAVWGQPVRPLFFLNATLDAILDAGRGDVLLASHDADFVPQLRRLLGAGRQVGVLGLREFVSVELAGLQDQWMAFYDLEDEVGAFTAVLPRIRIIPLAEFDPTRYL